MFVCPFIRLVKNILTAGSIGFYFHRIYILYLVFNFIIFFKNKPLAVIWLNCLSPSLQQQKKLRLQLLELEEKKKVKKHSFFFIGSRAIIEILMVVYQFIRSSFDKLSLNTAGCQTADSTGSVRTSIELELKDLRIIQS